MAARFWRCMLGLELLIAIALAWMLAATRNWSVLTGAAMTLPVLAAIQFLFVAAGYAASGTDERRRGARWVMRALATEPIAFGWAQLVMSAGARWRRLAPWPQSRAQTRRPVLLLHGILCNQALWGPLVARLQAAGFGPIAAIDLEPLDADIETYAARAQRELFALRRQCNGAPVAIVAHSMGGLVARALLRSSGAQCVSRIVTVASPHHGSAHARCLPFTAARQMRPDSPWLLALNAEQEGKLSAPLTSLYSRDDSLVTARSAALRGAESLELRGLGHFGQLRSARALQAIVTVLTKETDRGSRG